VGLLFDLPSYVTSNNLVRLLLAPVMFGQTFASLMLVDRYAPILIY